MLPDESEEAFRSSVGGKFPASFMFTGRAWQVRPMKKTSRRPNREQIKAKREACKQAQRKLR